MPHNIWPLPFDRDIIYEMYSFSLRDNFFPVKKLPLQLKFKVKNFGLYVWPSMSKE